MQDIERERIVVFIGISLLLSFILAVELGSWEIVAVSAKEVTEQCGKRQTKGDGEGSIMTRRQLSPYKP